MYVDVRILLKKQNIDQQDDGLRGAQEANEESRVGAGGARAKLDYL